RLAPAVWQTAVDFVSGTGNIVQAVHVGGGGRPARFYRVKLLDNSEVMPSAEFSGTPASGAKPLTVTFTDTSTGAITNRFWNFGDGTVLNTNAAVVSHTYV